MGVDAIGLRLTPEALPELIALQRELRPALERSVRVRHPEAPDLAGIYGVIFWESVGPDEQRNVTVFADGEIDRSPCGSGTSARSACCCPGPLSASSDGVTGPNTRENVSIGV